MRDMIYKHKSEYKIFKEWESMGETTSEAFADKEGGGDNGKEAKCVLKCVDSHTCDVG